MKCGSKKGGKKMPVANKDTVGKYSYEVKKGTKKK